MTTDTNQQHMAGLTGAATAMISGAAKNLGQLLGVPVDFKVLTIATNAGPAQEVTEEGVHLSVEFDGALTGDSWLVLATNDAKSIVRMMTQGMDVSEDDLLGELGMSALSEAMNQLMAGAATALSDGLGERIDISPPSISTDREPHPERAGAIVVTYEGAIADKASSKVVWQIDEALAADLGDRWLAATAPPPAPADSPLRCG